MAGGDLVAACWRIPCRPYVPVNTGLGAVLISRIRNSDDLSLELANKTPKWLRTVFVLERIYKSWYSPESTNATA